MEGKTFLAILTLVLVSLILFYQFIGVQRIRDLWNTKVTDTLPPSVVKVMYDKPIGPTQNPPYQLESKYIGDDDG